MSETDGTAWQGPDRRGGDRRKVDRRVSGERRRDWRDGSVPRRRSLRAWIRSILNPRLGVDRRKGGDQRSPLPRRDATAASLLTQAELDDLLK